MNIHEQERQRIVASFRQKVGREPVLAEAQLLQSVSWLESRYGTAWSTELGRASLNRGAIQYKTPSQLGLKPPYPEISPDRRGFLYTDTTPHADGTSTSYSVYFRRYDTHEAAIGDLIDQVYLRRPSVARAAADGDAYAFSVAMYQTGYYEGFGATREHRIANHHKAVKSALNRIAAAIGEPMPDGSMPVPPTIGRGSQGVTVKDWQDALQQFLDVVSGSSSAPDGSAWKMWINTCRQRDVDPFSVVSDGMFGQMTELLTRAYQEVLGIGVDGKVGPVTWASVGSFSAEEEKEPKPERVDDDVLAEVARTGKIPKGSSQQIVVELARRLVALESR